MAKARIIVKIIDYLKNETTTDVIGEINKNTKKVSYREGNLLGCVIIGKKVVFERSCQDYKLKLVFGNNETNKTKYEIYNPELALDIKTETIKLQIDGYNFDVEYILSINEEEIGLFCVDFKVEE